MEENLRPDLAAFLNSENITSYPVQHATKESWTLGVHHSILRKLPVKDLLPG